MAKTRKVRGLVRIVRTPAGEAPVSVRQAWVGLVLPCASYLGVPDKKPFSRKAPERGVLTGKPVECGKCGRVGVSVPQNKALKILAEANPLAAKWWRDHGFPHRGEFFAFAKDEVEIVSGVKMQQFIHVPEEMMGDPDR